MKKIEKLLNKIRDIQFIFGVEIEFYILHNISKDLIVKIENAIQLPVYKESGITQYEIATETFDNVFDLIKYIQYIKKVLIRTCKNNNAIISFHPKPFANDHGSGMHIHMSILNEQKMNIFNEYNNITENQYLLHTIGGILKLLNNSLYMLIEHDEYELHRLHFSEMAPSTVSWGKNNRTTAIRIPDSSPYNRNRRIEFRVPSSQSNIENCLLFLISAAIHGMQHEILPSECIYGNANDTCYSLTKLHSSFYNMKLDFKFDIIFKEICGNL